MTFREREQFGAKKLLQESYSSTEFTEFEESIAEGDAFARKKAKVFVKRRIERHNTPPTSDSQEDVDTVSACNLPSYYPCLICQKSRHISRFSGIQKKKRILYRKPAYCLKHYYGSDYSRIEAEAERMRASSESRESDPGIVNRSRILSDW